MPKVEHTRVLVFEKGSLRISGILFCVAPSNQHVYFTKIKLYLNTETDKSKSHETLTKSELSVGN